MTEMSESSERIPVPEPDAPYFPEICDFALTYNGYNRHGGSDGAAKIGKRTEARYWDTGELPDDLETLRCALFWVQRYVRWNDQEPGSNPLNNPGYAAYVKALVTRIGEISGGSVPGPADPAP